MAVSVRLEPTLEKELELTARRMGMTKSQFIVSALEKALGRKNPYDLLLKAQSEVRELLPENSLQPSATKSAIRAKLQSKHEASRADWQAFQTAKQKGQTWSAADSETPAP